MPVVNSRSTSGLGHRAPEEENFARNDQQLVARIVAHDDSEAFETLVIRHNEMVLKVCRGMLHHHPDVEGAFQATFLVLALKIRENIGITVSYWKDLDSIKQWKNNIEHLDGSLGGRKSIAGWLYPLLDFRAN